MRSKRTNLRRTSLIGDSVLILLKDIERALRDDLKEPSSFVIRDWMPICPPEFVSLLEDSIDL